MKTSVLVVLLLVVGWVNTSADGVNLTPYRDRFQRERPLVAIVAQNQYTEITDFLVPFGILSASGGVDVHALSMRAGPIEGFPALRFEVPETVAEFDLNHPEGADYIVVPAVHESSDPLLLEWVNSQARKGCVVVGVCDGVWVLAKAGLLDGRSAVGHWNSLPDLKRQFIHTTWVPDRRYWQDASVITTTGVSASVPISLALIEALCGRDRAQQTAAALGLTDLGPEHRTGDYSWSWNEYATLSGNWTAFWNHERVTLPVFDGMDEISLAVTADAWGRTFRAEVKTSSVRLGSIASKRGLKIVVDQDLSASTSPSRSVKVATLPGRALPQALGEIQSTYGPPTESLVRRLVELDADR